LVAAVPGRLDPRPIHIEAESADLGLLGPAVERVGESAASIRIKLGASGLPSFPANAEWMSLGPPGPWIPDTASSTRFRVNSPTHHRLRVTYGSCELSWWMVIDDIETGRADSRWLNASYELRELDKLWGALSKVPRVWALPPDPPIVWRSPTSFAWIMRADTLVVEQVAGPVFQLTLKARVR
jgi:hypothetical protein